MVAKLLIRLTHSLQNGIGKEPVPPVSL